MAEFIENFAFFWIGENTTIPQYLVDSINYTYSNQAKIYMLTDKKTRHINGVTKTIRSFLPKEIMLARLKAYSLLKIDQQVLFLDADSIVLDKQLSFPSGESFIIFRRKKEGIIINHNYPEWYPEFINKTFDEMMPFLFGAMVSSDKNISNYFLKLLNIAKNLPPRFHRWYGDQLALKNAIDNNIFNFKEYKFNDYFSIVENEEDINLIDKSIVTFKGSNSKKIIANFYETYFK